MDAVHWTSIHTCSVFYADAGLGDHISHSSPSQSEIDNWPDLLVCSALFYFRVAPSGSPGSDLSHGAPIWSDPHARRRMMIRRSRAGPGNLDRARKTFGARAPHALI